MVSVIVPVYNGSSVIDKSIGSLLRQTYANIEVIIVDDGSVDATQSRCLRLASLDDRVRYIRISKSGVSAARNVGLRAASGDYVAFLDADDYVETNMYEIMIRDLEDYHADACVCEYTQHIGDRLISHGLPWEQHAVLDQDVLMHQYIPFLVGNLRDDPYFVLGMGAVWRILFRRSKISGLLFDEDLVFREDALFCMKAFLCDVKHVVVEKRCLYHYVVTDNSTIIRYQDNFFAINILFYDRLPALFDQYSGVLDCKRYVSGRFKNGYIRTLYGIVSHYGLFYPGCRRIVKHIGEAFRSDDSMDLSILADELSVSKRWIWNALSLRWYFAAYLIVLVDRFIWKI